MISADAPGTYANGIGENLAILDRVGNAPLSTSNSQSYNMIPDDKVPYVPGYVGDQIANNFSMSFDGVDDYFDAGNSDSFSFGNGTTDSAFSVSAWGYIDTLSNFTIVTKGVYSTTGEWHMRMTGSNQMHLVLYDGTAYEACIINESLSTNQWYHFAFTYDGGGGADANDGIIGYLNGSPATLSRVDSGNYQAMTNSTAPLYIAKNGSNYSHGKIDEVAIFDKALTADQIKFDLYQPSLPAGSNKTADIAKNPNLPTPVAWYRMGD